VEEKMNDRTIVFYSGNTENSLFEGKIMDDLKEKVGDIPIVSVTQIPVDLGTNICVGKQPFSYTSEWKQVLIALKAAKTKYCIAAESDCLYPPEYFSFTPSEEKMMYNYTNIWMVWKNHGGFWKKTGYCEGAQMCDREYWIERLEPLLPEKWEPYTRKEETALVQKIFPTRREWTGRPMISFKTGGGVSNRTTFINERIQEIDYWGEINKLKGKYL
jgi:hypothetical protein